MNVNRAGGGMQRREFLMALGASGAALIAGLGTGLLACAGAGSLRSALSEFYSDRAAARIVGQIYLNLAADENDPERLVALIAGEQLAEWQSLAGDRDALYRAVRARHRSDFENGNTASIDGWLLSRTEARLCALVALG